MYGRKMRWSSAAVVFFFVLGMLSLPGVEVGATAALPYYNHFGAEATETNHFGFDGLTLNNDDADKTSKGTITVVPDPEDKDNTVLQFFAKSTSTSADPFAHLNIVKADMEQPLVMSFRVKQVKDEGNIQLLFRGSGFMNVFNLEQSKVTFFPKFVELGTDKASNPSSIVLERVNDGAWKKVIIMADYKNKTANVFYNGEFSQYDVPLIANEVSKGAAGAVTPMRIQGRMDQGLAIDSSTSYVDDLKIYTKKDLTVDYAKEAIDKNAGSFVISFGNEMNPSALNRENIILEKQSGSGMEAVAGYTVTAEAPAQSSGTKVTLGLPALEASAVYQIRFTEQMKDVFGQTPAAVVFTTKAEAGAPVVTLAVKGETTVRENTDVTVEGTVENAGAATEAEIIQDGAPAVTVPVNGGAFTHTFTAPAVGTHNVTARVTSGGVSGTSNVAAYTVLADQPPVLRWIAPAADGAVYDCRSGAKRISVHASDSDGAVAQVNLYDGDILLGEMQAGTGGEYSFSTELAEGTHALKAIAVDDGGKQTEITSTAKAVSFTETKIAGPFTFDDYTDTSGAVFPDGFKDSGFSNLNGGTVRAEQGSVKLEMTAPGSAPFIGRKCDPKLKGRLGIEGTFTFHGELKPESTATSRSLFMVREDKAAVPGATGTYFGTPLVVNGNKLCLNSNPVRPLMELEADTPYQIKVIWDLSGGFADVYVNGSKLAEQMRFVNSDGLAQSAISNWRILTNNYVTEANYTLLDDLSFYQLESEEKVVSLREPLAGAEFDAGTEITLRAEATSGLTAMKYYDGDTEIASVAEAPYAAVYTVTEGDHDIVAKAVYGDYEAAAEAVRITGVNRKWNLVTEQNFEDVQAARNWLTEIVEVGGSIAFEGGAAKLASAAEKAAPYIGKSFSPVLGGTVMLEGDFTFSNIQHKRNLMMVRNSRADGSGVFATPVIAEKGNLYFVGKNYGNDPEMLIQPLEEDVKYTIRVVWNIETHLADVYVNDVCKIQQKKLDYSDEIHTLTTMRFVTDTYVDSEGFTVVDNLRIQSVGEGPQVTGVTVGGASETENVPVSAGTIAVSFDSDLADTGIQPYVSLTAADGEDVAYTGAYDKTSRTFTMTLPRDLRYGIRYTLKIDRALKGLNYAELGEDYTYSFTTEDIPVKVSAVERTDSGGNAVTALTPGGTVNTVVKVARQDAGAAMVFAALYNEENTLVQAQTETLTFAGAGEKSTQKLVIQLPDQVEGHVLRTLVFESAETLKPVFFNVPRDQTLPLRDISTPLTVYLVSDSICQYYQQSDYPQEGWGQNIGQFFQEGVAIDNRAVGGRSTKSFISEGRWAGENGILKTLKPGDYVFLSMGHNDRNTAAAEKYTTIAEYQSYLERYIDDTARAGASIVLITPPTEMWGHGNSLEERSGAMREVAVKKGVPLLDLNAVSYKHFMEMGADAAKEAYYLTAKVLADAGSAKAEDLTHFSHDGAVYLAQTITELLKASGDPLGTLVK